MGYVACLGQIPEETAHVLQNLVSAHTANLRQNACFANHKSYIIGKLSKLCSIYVPFR